MTDDDEARQLAEARARREALNELLGRVDAVEARLAAHDEQLGHLAELVTEADVRTPFHWPDVDDVETRTTLWDGLVEWVETVLVPWHPDVARLLAPCWWQHRPIVGLLTDAWVAWVGDYRNQEARPHDGIVWRREVLPLLEEGLKPLGSCKSGARVHVPDVPVEGVVSTVPRGGEMPGTLAD